MESALLIKCGESYQRLINSPDWEFVDKYLQKEIQAQSTQILQGSFKEFPEEYWKAVGRLRGLAELQTTMKNVIVAMNQLKDKKKKEEAKSAS